MEPISPDTDSRGSSRRDDWDELQGFAPLVGRSRPLATWVLASILALVFGLELFWTLGSGTVGLARMGALIPSRVAVGEWWRLLSCTFLHGGIVHLVANVFVLVVVGTLLERVLGTARFVLLYAVSAVGGSVAGALTLGDGHSVGASGALWGLLVAIAIVAWRPDGLLPAGAVRLARWITALNLVVQLLVSMRPNVDVAAHLGGAVAGGVLMWSGVLVRGLPRRDAGKRPGWPRRGARLVAVVSLTALAVAWIVGRPWELRQDPRYERRLLAELNISLEIPDLLEPQAIVSARSDHREAAFGEILLDPARVSVSRHDLDDPVPPQVIPSEIAGFERKLARPPRDMRLLDGPRRVSIRDLPALTVTYGYPSGLVLERVVLLVPDTLWRVEAFRWPELPSYRGIAERTMASIEPLEGLSSGGAGAVSPDDEIHRQAGEHEQ